MSNLILHSNGIHELLNFCCPAFQASNAILLGKLISVLIYIANICRSTAVIRSEDVATSSEEEADANEVAENSVCLFPQLLVVQLRNKLGCLLCLPNSFDLSLFLNARRKRRVRNKLAVKEQLLEVEAGAEVPPRRGGGKQILLPSKVWWAKMMMIQKMSHWRKLLLGSEKVLSSQI